MYGLNDAPSAFQLCQTDFYITELEALQSRFDEDFMFWLRSPVIPYALASSHVDDNEIGAEKDKKTSLNQKDRKAKMVGVGL